MKPQVEKIIEDIKKFDTKAAVFAIKDWMYGEDKLGLDCSDFQEILDAWVDRFYPEKCKVDVESEDEMWMKLFRFAHENDITVNQAVTLALEEQIRNKERIDE